MEDCLKEMNNENETLKSKLNYVFDPFKSNQNNNNLNLAKAKCAYLNCSED